MKNASVLMLNEKSHCINICMITTVLNKYKNLHIEKTPQKEKEKREESDQ